MRPMKGEVGTCASHTIQARLKRLTVTHSLTLGAIRNANSTTVSNHVHKAGNFKFFCSFLIFILKREIESKTGSCKTSCKLPYFLCILSESPQGTLIEDCTQEGVSKATFHVCCSKTLPFPYLTQCPQVQTNSKWTRDLNGRAKTCPQKFPKYLWEGFFTYIRSQFPWNPKSQIPIWFPA